MPNRTPDRAALISHVRETLCLDYANTLSWRGSAAPAESLHDFAGLLAWLEKTAGVDADPVREIGRWSHDHPQKAARLFADVIGAREVIFRIFSAVAAGNPARSDDFAALSGILAAAPVRHELARADGAYAWRVAELRPVMADLLAPVLWSAGDLLLNAPRRRIRQCANEKCLWLFLDESKSGTRRWCDMSSCGNRNKARRHYLKQKKG